MKKPDLDAAVARPSPRAAEARTMNTGQLHQERLARYVAALRNEKAGKIPIRLFLAEFVADYAGCKCQQVFSTSTPLP